MCGREIRFNLQIGWEMIFQDLARLHFVHVHDSWIHLNVVGWVAAVVTCERIDGR